MPYSYTDWKDEVIPIVDTSGSPVSTVGWSLEMHIRSEPDSTPALLILSTAAGTLLVGQTTTTGANNGIVPNITAASMSIAPQTFVWDIKRIDGGRNEWIIGGNGEFEQPVTVIGSP